MNFRIKLSQEALFPRNKIKKKMQNNLDVKIVSGFWSLVPIYWNQVCLLEKPGFVITFRNCLKISRRENMSVEMLILDLSFVPSGTTDRHIFIDSTDI
jgi:hypothetical protein